MTRVRFQLRELIVDRAERFGWFLDPDAEAGAYAEWNYWINDGTFALHRTDDFQGGEHVALDRPAMVIDALLSDPILTFRGIEEDDAPNADDTIPSLTVRVNDLVKAADRAEFRSPPHDTFSYRLIADQIRTVLPDEIVAAPSGTWHHGVAQFVVTRGSSRQVDLIERNATTYAQRSTGLRTTTGATICSDGTYLLIAYTSTEEFGVPAVCIARAHPGGDADQTSVVPVVAAAAPSIAARGTELWLAVSGTLIGINIAGGPPLPANRLLIFRSVDSGMNWSMVADTPETSDHSPAIAFDAAGTPWVAWVGTDGGQRLNLAALALSPTRDSGHLVVDDALRGVADSSDGTPALGFDGVRPVLAWVGTDGEQRANTRRLVDTTEWSGHTSTESFASAYGPCYMPPNPNPTLRSAEFAWVNGSRLFWWGGWPSGVYVGGSSSTQTPNP